MVASFPIPPALSSSIGHPVEGWRIVGQTPGSYSFSLYKGASITDFLLVMIVAPSTPSLLVILVQKLTNTSWCHSSSLDFRLANLRRL
jgi:hypothetical protein